MDRTTQGTHDQMICSRDACALGAAGGGMVPAEVSCVRSAGEVQISAGCQTFRKPTRQAMQKMDAPMSTIQGLT
jgi:hypothetical protein